MVNIPCALYKKNKDVGLRLKENIKICICANKSAHHWMSTALGVLPGFGERGAHKVPSQPPGGCLVKGGEP